MRILLLLILIFRGITVSAQMQLFKFGEIDQKLLTKETHAEYPEAKAEIIYDKGQVEFVEHGFYTSVGMMDYSNISSDFRRVQYSSTNDPEPYWIRFQHTQRKKIYDATDPQQTRLTIRLKPGEELKELLLAVYNLDEAGITQTYFDRNNLEEEVLNDYITLNHVDFPEVRNGSVVEFRYVIESPNLVKMPEWNFQHDIPLFYSEFKFIRIPFYEYQFFTQQIDEFNYAQSEEGRERQLGQETTGNITNTVAPKFKESVTTFVMRDVAPFQDTAFITSKTDHIKKIFFYLSKKYLFNGGTLDYVPTQETLTKTILEDNDFKKYLRGVKKYARDIAKSNNIDELSKPDQIQWVINYIKDEFHWNGNKSVFPSQSVKDFVDGKTGNNADINLFLIGVMDYLDIDAHPVILSTRDNGRVLTDFPSLTSFNYLLAGVDFDERLLTDASRPLLANDLIPSECLHDFGLFLDKKYEGWVTLTNVEKSSTTKNITIRPDIENMQAAVIIDIRATDMEAHKLRLNAGNTRENIISYFDVLDSYESADVSDFTERNSPVAYTLNGKMKMSGNADSVAIYPLLGFYPDENPFPFDYRKYPIEMDYPLKDSVSVTLHIPDGYTIASLPKNINSNSGDLQLSVNYQQNGNELQIHGYYAIERATFKVREFITVRNFYNRLTEALNPEILLVKE